METSESSWMESRPLIFEYILRNNSFNCLCFKCREKNASIICKECEQLHLCYTCDIEIHADNPFHDRVSYASGYPCPMSPLEALNKDLELDAIGKHNKLYIYIYTG